MTVLDSSAVVELLLGGDGANDVAKLAGESPSAVAPDLLVFEVLSALRRATLRGAIGADRAARAVQRLGELRIELVPTLLLRQRAWELRENLTAGDALFVALAERLGESLATRDRGMAAAARKHAGIKTIELG